MIEIDEYKLKIIHNVFSQVKNLYQDYSEKILELKDFFKNNKVAGGYYVTLDFEPSKEYPIDWITKLKQQIRSKAINQGLFKILDDREGVDAILINTFLEFSNAKHANPEPKKLLNPKSYFRLNVQLNTPTGESTSQTGGTGYALLALLCIARLSLIEKAKRDKIKKGIRYIAIDEVAGLGENFDMLYKIAHEYDYQIITMTIDPIGKFESGKQYVYTLRRNNIEKYHNINPTPLLQIDQDNLLENLQDYEHYLNILKNE